MMNHKYASCPVILQEFDLQLNSPKGIKVLIFTEFITTIPIETHGSPVNDSLPNEQLFLVSTNDL